MFKRLLPIASLTVLAGWCVIASAQPPAKPNAPPLTRDREEVAEKDVPRTNDINQVKRYARSTEPDFVIKTDADRAVVDKVLKYYLFRLTWEEVQRDRDPAKVGTVGTIMSELIGSPPESQPQLLPSYFQGPPADQDMAAMRTRQLNNVMQMTPIFIKYCKVLLQNQNPIARVNAARVLCRLAEWGQEAVVDEFINIIKHPQESDAVRLWAFHGLEAIFLMQGSSDIKAKGLFQSKPGQARLVAALEATYEWLQANTKLPEQKIRYMKADEQAGLRYVRRAAVKALGASHKALIVDDRAGNKQSGSIAQLIGNILSAEAGIVPAPDIRERFAAALALCQIRGEAGSSYNADFAAYQLGSFLTVLGTEINEFKKGEAAVNGLPYVAQQLRTALDAFKSQRLTGPAASYTKGMYDKALPLLEYIDDFSKNTSAIKDLNDWLRENPPVNKEYIKPLGAK